MERDWEPRHPAPEVGRETLERALAGHAAGRPILGAVALPGGKVNLHLLVELGEPRERVVLRVRLEAPEAAAKEARILQRLAGEVPLPRLLDQGVAAIGGAERPWLLLSWVAGTALDLRFGHDAPAVLERAGRETGAALARVHAHARPHLGFLDGALRVPAPMGPLVETWAAYLRERLASPRTARRLGAARTAALRAVVDACAQELEPLGERYALLHADCKPVNVLADDTGAVTALLDWEFAWAGPPLFDWGQMRRWPLPPAFEAGLVAGYRAGGGLLEGPWRRQARLLDLMNLLGFADAEGERPRTLRDVSGLLDATCAALAAGDQ